MRAIPICAVLAMAFATSAATLLSPKYSEWGNGPVQHLMTKEEKKQWKAIQTDTDADAFVDLFWAKRDPTPDTPRNEFREAFDARVKFADDNFTNHRTRGALTDRGKVLILLGGPEQASGSGGATSTSSLGLTGKVVPEDSEGGISIPRPTSNEARQVWTYAHDKKPKYVKRPDFVLAFVEVGRDDWQLARTERVNPEAVLMEAVSGLIVSPNLTKAPFSSTAPQRIHAKAFRDLFLDTAYKEFKSANKPAVGPADLTWGEFVSPTGEPFVSVQLYVPAGAEIKPGQKVTFFGVIENAAGEILEVHEDSMAMNASGTDAYVDKSFPIAPGSYTATFGLAADGKVISARRTPLKIEAVDAASAGVSPLILSESVKPLDSAWGDMDPFTFGGLKVVPKGDAQFTPKGDLWYFVEMRNPGVTPEGAPKVRVQVDIAGKTPKGPVMMNFPLGDAETAKLKGTKDRYAVGLAIPLESFVPGDYTMKLKLIDTVLNKTYNLEREFKVRG
jgi:GWxTD domain-containing protein